VYMHISPSWSWMSLRVCRVGKVWFLCQLSSTLIYLTHPRSHQSVKARLLPGDNLGSHGLFVLVSVADFDSSGTNCIAIDDAENPLVGNVAILTRCTTAKLLLQLISSRWTESADGFCGDLAGRVVVVLHVGVWSDQASCRILEAAQMRWLTATWHAIALRKEVHGLLIRGRV
jgi:hypothetical protein